MALRSYRTGYVVYLYGEQYWKRTLRSALRFSELSLHWCNGEHNQVIRARDSKRIR